MLLTYCTNILKLVKSIRGTSAIGSASVLLEKVVDECEFEVFPLGSTYAAKGYLFEERDRFP